MKYYLILILYFYTNVVFSSVEGTIHKDSIVLGSGCFWGAEKTYEAIPGVIKAISGYADGKGVVPSYKEITKFKNKYNPNNHAEVVKVIFNPDKVKVNDI